MTWVVGGAGTDETFNGVINNECSNKSYKGVTTIVKEGKGYWKLTGANIYSGTTTVKGGTLIVNGVQTGTGKVTVNSDATLAGKGTIPAAVEVQAGGFLKPGDPSIATFNIGTLTIGSLNLMSGSQTNMDISKSLLLNDKIAATGAVVLGGTLNLTISGTLAAGDLFTLFTGSSFTGSFTNIVPATPGANLAWEMAGGVLKVVTAVNAIDQVESQSFTISPNPAIDRISIKTTESFEGVNAEVTDIAGKKVKSIDQSEFSSASVNDLSSGIYFVVLKAGDKVVGKQKLIKR